MTDTTPTIDRVENDVVAENARAAVTPHFIAPGLYLTPGTGETIDVRRLLEADRDHPTRKTAQVTVTDATSLLSYLEKHALPETELWANDREGTIHAVINAHQDSNGNPGWSDHTVTLKLPFTPDWKDWTARSGRLVTQTEFAEFIEDHLHNFVEPSGADMLELAQTFQATTKVDFQSSKRLKSGETQVSYVEDTSATAGKKGDLAIPDSFTIALQVHDRGPTYKVQARLRYRINGGKLQLAYRLDRADDVRRHAFDEVVTHVSSSTGRAIWSTD